MIGINGLSISHFRNFGEVPSERLIFTKINAFIGGNNSGKSNVLRFIRDVYIPVANRNPNAEIRDGGINQSRFASSPPKSIWMAISADAAAFEQAFPHTPVPMRLQAVDDLARLPQFDQATKRLFVPILKRADSGKSIDRDAVQELSLNSHIVHQLWASLGRSGGSYNQHWLPDVIEHLYEKQRVKIDPVYIPAFRQIDTKLAEFNQEYNPHIQGSHIIDDLAVFASPTWNDQEKRQSFIKLRDFIADILEIPDVKIDIPHDRNTINIDTNGYYLPIETYGAGIHELVILASHVILNEGKVVLLEEPEVHLHPQFQRKFIKFISERINSQFFLTTHSPTVIDADDVRVFGVNSVSGVATVSELLRDQRRRVFCNDLGYKPSDLLQSNCVIWVEGPSDRIYLLHWLAQKDPLLREGIDFSIVFYGGRLLSHLSISDSEVSELINILAVNRFCCIVIDSDKGSETQQLNATKQRIVSEIETVGGISWVTAGREIESYIPNNIRLQAIKEVYSGAESLSGGLNRWGKPLDFRTDSGEEKTVLDKMKVARAVVQNPADFSPLDLGERIEALVDFISKANSKT